jgi:hypothetical protein
MSDENQNEVIKNPERGEQTQHFVVPEHVRLGVTPVYQDFVSLDGEAITESEQVDSHIHDNNEYVNYGFNIKPPTPAKSKSPGVGDFVLMVSGKVVSHGSHDFILAQAKAILYGEHPKYLEQDIQVDDIVVLKRLGLKVGVFLDE